MKKKLNSDLIHNRAAELYQESGGVPVLKAPGSVPAPLGGRYPKTTNRTLPSRQIRAAIDAIVEALNEN